MIDVSKIDMKPMGKAKKIDTIKKPPDVEIPPQPPIIKEPLTEKKTNDVIRVQKIDQTIGVEHFEPEEKIIRLKEELPDYLYIVQVIHPSLRKRKEPNASSEIVGYITDMGQYKIINEQNDWGQLEDGSWIMLNFVKRIK